MSKVTVGTPGDFTVEQTPKALLAALFGATLDVQVNGETGYNQPDDFDQLRQLGFKLRIGVQWTAEVVRADGKPWRVECTEQTRAAQSLRVTGDDVDGLLTTIAKGTIHALSYPGNNRYGETPTAFAFAGDMEGAAFIWAESAEGAVVVEVDDNIETLADLARRYGLEFALEYHFPEVARKGRPYPPKVQEFIERFTAKEREKAEREAEEQAKIPAEVRARLLPGERITHFHDLGSGAYAYATESGSPKKRK
ncbi:MAG TPA: hypothetical protein VGL38_03915 [bacterium]|jgi:hypothetical protein